MHWCADETAALMSVLGIFPFAWRWARGKVILLWKKLRS